MKSLARDIVDFLLLCGRQTNMHRTSYNLLHSTSLNNSLLVVVAQLGFKSLKTVFTSCAFCLASHTGSGRWRYLIRCL